MADDETYDPNVGVAPWINVVIPIVSMVTLAAVLVALYVLPYEIDVNTLELWAEKIPCLKNKEVPTPNEIPAQERNGEEKYIVANETDLRDKAGIMSSEHISIPTGQPPNYGSIEIADK